MKALRISLSMLMFLLFAVADVHGQAENDFDNRGRPVERDGKTQTKERYDAHASCDSKVLPKAGYKILKPVPGREGECYWVRDDQITIRTKPGETSELPNYLKVAKTPSQALELAQQFHETRLDYINRQRIETTNKLGESFLKCGSDVGCLYNVISAAKSRQDQLNLDEKNSMKLIEGDVDIIREHFNLSDFWPYISDK